VIEWTRVRRIVAQKVDRVTYDEVFIRIDSLDGSSIVVGQLDSGFDALIQQIAGRFVSKDSTWLAEVDAKEPDKSFVVLYDRDEGVGETGGPKRDKGPRKGQERGKGKWGESGGQATTS
jgi:hypothetical protein